MRRSLTAAVDRLATGRLFLGREGGTNCGLVRSGWYLCAMMGEPCVGGTGNRGPGWQRLLMSLCHKDRNSSAATGHDAHWT